MLPHYDTHELHSEYIETPAIDKNCLKLIEPISFKPGMTRFTFPAGHYKPIEEDSEYTYYLSPYGTLVDPVGHPYFVEGGIKLNIVTGDLKFISFMGELSVGTQNIRSFTGRIEMVENE